MNILQKIIGNTLIQILGGIITGLLGFSIGIKIANYLGVDNFGVFTFLQSYISIFVVVVNFGIEPAVLRMISRDAKNSPLILGNMLFIKFILSMATIFLALGLAYIIGFAQAKQMVLFISCLSLLSWGFGAMVVVLQERLKMFYNNLAQIISLIFFLVIILNIIQFRLNLQTIITAWVVTIFLRWGMVYFFARRQIAPVFRISRDLIRKILKEALPLAATAIATTLYFHLDVLFLSKWQKEYAVGIYGAAYRLVSFLTFIPLALTVSIYPLLSRYFVKNKAFFSELFEKSLHYMMLLAFPIAFLGAFSARRIIYFLYRPDYYSAAYVLMILVWAAAFIFLNYILSFTLIAANRQRQLLACAVLSLFINIISCIILIPHFSFIGAAWAALLTQIASFGGFIYFLYKKESIKIKLVFLPRIILVTSLASLFSILLERANFFWFIFAPPILYFLLVYGFGCIHNEDIKLLLQRSKNN
jgi:O-antigen/teichoic acid export membrane protein